jgi:hypothetical protein
VEAACVTLALVRTSVLRPSQSAQLSEAIVFFRFQQRHRQILRQRALRRLCNIEHIGGWSIGGHGGKAARQDEGKTRIAKRRDWAIRQCEQFGTERLSMVH